MYEKIFLVKDIDMCLSTSQIVSNLLAEKRAFVKFLYDRIIESKKPYCTRDAKRMADCLQIPLEMLYLRYDILGSGNLLHPDSSFCRIILFPAQFSASGRLWSNYEIYDFNMELGNLSRFWSQAADSVAKFYFLLNSLHLFEHSIIANLFVFTVR